MNTENKAGLVHLLRPPARKRSATIVVEWKGMAKKVETSMERKN